MLERDGNSLLQKSVPLSLPGIMGEIVARDRARGSDEGGEEGGKSKYVLRTSAYPFLGFSRGGEDGALSIFSCLAAFFRKVRCLLPMVKGREKTRARRSRERERDPSTASREARNAAGGATLGGDRGEGGRWMCRVAGEGGKRKERTKGPAALPVATRLSSVQSSHFLQVDELDLADQRLPWALLLQMPSQIHYCLYIPKNSTLTSGLPAGTSLVPSHTTHTLRQS